MNKLSEHQVSTLNQAIDKTMDIIDETGVDPNTAIIKVAQSMHLTPDYIPVIVAAYNNGAQYAQRENGNSILEKTAKFPIANIDAINKALYKTQKKASAVYALSDDFFDYPATVVLANSNNNANKLLYTPVVKAASYRRENTTQIKNEDRVNDGVNSVLESIRMEKSAAADAYDDAIKELGYYLKLNASPSVPYSEKLASLVYGKPGSIIIKAAADRFSLSTKPKQFEPVVSEKDSLYTLCDSCIKKLAEYDKICEQEMSLMAKCASMLRPIVDRRTKEIYKESSLNDNSPAYFFEKKKIDSSEQLEKKAAPFSLIESSLNYDKNPQGNKLTYSDLSALEALSKPQWRDLNEYEHNIMRSLDDPEQEAKLRDITVKTNLIDLINSDEYLSDQDPEEIIDAYNELMEIAPEIHNKKPLLRAALRQYMESGGIDVQSLGLIGDVGRKSESREDAKKTELINQIEKMLDYANKAKYEERNSKREDERWEKQKELTISEGRKQRAAQAEENRKQRSEQRKLVKERERAERDRELLRLADAEKGRQAQRDLETLKDSLTRGRDKINNQSARDTKYLERRDEAVADFLNRWTRSGGKNRSIYDINNSLQNFNSLDAADRRAIYDAYDEMGLGSSAGSHLSNKKTNFTVNPTTGEVTLTDPSKYRNAQISEDELDFAASNYADRIKDILEN